MSQINGLIYRETCGDHADVDLLLPGQAQSRDDASSEIDQGTVRPGETCVRIEHGRIIGEEMTKISGRILEGS
jgi:hypothetical protein